MLTKGISSILGRSFSGAVFEIDQQACVQYETELILEILSTDIGKTQGSMCVCVCVYEGPVYPPFPNCQELGGQVQAIRGDMHQSDGEHCDICHCE
jgi:hypothetical protein